MNRYIASFLAASALAFTGTTAMAQDAERSENLTEEHRIPAESATRNPIISDSELAVYTGKMTGMRFIAGASGTPQKKDIVVK